MHAVMLGNLMDGHSFVGPFKTEEAAITWAEFNVQDDDWWVIALDSPFGELEGPEE